MADHVEAVTVEQLKPCPFCGGEAMQGGYAIAPDGYWCSCQRCGVCRDGYRTKAEAIAAWNARTQANEAMREALYRISNAHLPDQPATSSLDETEWAIQHIRRIRAIARAALSGDSA